MRQEAEGAVAPGYLPGVENLATAVILGGGRGTRLWPLTKVRAKPAVPLGGKYRLIDIPISLCLNSGLSRISILTQFNSSSLNQHVARCYHFDQFSNRSVSLLAANQSEESGDWYQGTSDAVRRNIRHIRQWRTPHVIILPGDAIFRMDLRDLLRTHIKHESDITVALNTCDESRAPGFGIVRMDASQRLVDIVEKPGPEKLAALKPSEAEMRSWGFEDISKPYLASMGIYVFRAEVLEDMLCKDFVDFGKHLLPAALNQYKMTGHVFPGFWEDIGTIRAFYNVNLRLAQNKPPFSFYVPDAPIHTRTRFLPSSRLGKVNAIESIVTEGCRIGEAELDRCMVGIRSIIGQRVRLSRTIMMGADYYEAGKPQSGFVEIAPNAPSMGLGDDVTIENAIIDKNARIGSGVTIRDCAGQPDYDDPEERYYIRDGIVIVPKHAILPPSFEIGPQ